MVDALGEILAIVLEYRVADAIRASRRAERQLKHE